MSGSRRTAEVLGTFGRDEGKLYIITELPAAQIEAWALRLFLAMSRAGIEVPDEVQQAGIAGIATMGWKKIGLVAFEDAKVLFDEMFTCVSYRPDPNNPYSRPPLPDDIEEVATRIKLRVEIFTLHTGFSPDVAKVDLGVGGDVIPGTVSYANIPSVIAIIVSSRLATLHELNSVYGIKDAYDMLEIIAIDNHNRRKADAYMARVNAHSY